MSLVEFGFTNTQDVVYKALLRIGPATGYAIARGVNIARANVYQALDALVARGLATSTGGRPSTFSAVSAAECLRRLGIGTAQDLAKLAGELGASLPAGGPSSRPDAGRISSLPALLGAAVRAVDASRREVLAVVGPWAGEVAGAVERARHRGLTCRVVFLGESAPEAAVQRIVSEAELTSYWGGLPVLIVCDRARAICGVLREGVAEGLDTRSSGVVPFLRHLLRRELAAAASPH